MLKLAAENIEITVTSAVVRELEDISKISDSEGKAAREILDLISSGEIQVEEIETENKVREITSTRVEEGEASCFVCCQEKKIKNLIMDDIEAASSLEGRAISNGIRQKISVAVVVDLMKQNIISEKSAEEAISKLKESRDWKGGVLEVLANKYLPEK